MSKYYNEQGNGYYSGDDDTEEDVIEEEEDERKQVYEWRECTNVFNDGVVCGRRFYISVAEKKYFDSKVDHEGNSFKLPKRCYYCRKARKEERGM